jgi:hypothetical protein
MFAQRFENMEYAGLVLMNVSEMKGGDLPVNLKQYYGSTT